MNYLNITTLVVAGASIVVSVLTLVERHRGIAARRAKMGIPKRGLWDVLRARDWYKDEHELGGWRKL